MKISAAIIATLATSSTAFTPPSIPQQQYSSTKLYSTIEKPTTAPERTAPSAGYEPEWEGRTGLSPEEFMKSDMNKPDLSGMWECPLTLWDSEG